MKHHLTKQRVFLAAICVLLVVVIPFLWYWLFGWGTIKVIDFSATDVEYVKISCSHHSECGTIFDPVEIQALIDEANAMENRGSDLKTLVNGVFMGGAVLYESTFYLNNGTEFLLTFCSSSDDASVSDMELNYWYYRFPPGERTDGTMCRGSLEVYFELFEKYTHISPPV